jgi:hypothetical protein
MKVTRGTVSTILTVMTVALLAVALPSAIRDTFETGRVYLFSRQFLDELSQRFIGPGRLRFVLQPVMAVLLGWRDGRADARAGRPAYLYGLIVSADKRREMILSGWSTIRDLMAMGIMLDAVAQLLIYREVHPGAALVIGPVLITLPYATSRALTNRVARRFGAGPSA